MPALTARDFDIDFLGHVTLRPPRMPPAAVDPSRCSEPGCTLARGSGARSACDAYCARHCRLRRKHGHACPRTRLAAYMRIYMRTYERPNPAASEVAA